MNAKHLKTAALWMLLLTSDTVAQILLKIGAVKTQTSGWRVHYLVFVGYSVYMVSFVAWMQILKTTRLSIALTAASMLYITIAVASHFLMGEAITNHVIIGTILIATGVFVLGIGEGRKDGGHH